MNIPIPRTIGQPGRWVARMDDGRGNFVEVSLSGSGTPDGGYNQETLKSMREAIMEAVIERATDIKVVCGVCNLHYQTLDGREPGDYPTGACPICPDVKGTVIRVLPGGRFQVRKKENTQDYIVTIELRSIVEKSFTVEAKDKKEAENIALELIKSLNKDELKDELHARLEVDNVMVESV